MKKQTKQRILFALVLPLSLMIILGILVNDIWGCFAGLWIGFVINLKIEENRNRSLYHGHYKITNSRYIKCLPKGDPTLLPAIYQLTLIADVICNDYIEQDKKLSIVKQQYLSQYDSQKQAILLDILCELILHPELTANIEVAGKYICDTASYSERYRLLETLFQIAKADGLYNSSDNDLIKNITSCIGITSKDFIQLFNKYVHPNFYSNTSNNQNTRQSSNQAPPPPPIKTQSTSAYNILGIQPSATNEEVKSAYRRLALQYHPDRMIDADEVTRHQAEEKFRRITQAYQKIKTIRGIK